MVYPILIDVSVPATARTTSLPYASWIKGGIRYLYHLVNHRKAIHPRVVGFRGIKGFGLLVSLCFDNRPPLTPPFRCIGSPLSLHRPTPAPTTKLLVRDNQIVFHSPAFDRSVSSSSRHTLQTALPDSGHRTVTSPLEGQSRGVGLDDMSQPAIQNPVLEHGGQIVRQRSSRKATALPEAPPPRPTDLNSPQPSQIHTQADGHLGGAGQSRSDPRSTPSDRSASRRGVRGGKDSRGPPVRGNDRGRSRPGARPNDLIPTCMPLVLILAYLYLIQLVARFSLQLTQHKRSPSLFVLVPYPSVRHFISLEKRTLGLSRNHYHH